MKQSVAIVGCLIFGRHKLLTFFIRINKCNLQYLNFQSIRVPEFMPVEFHINSNNWHVICNRIICDFNLEKGGIRIMAIEKWKSKKDVEQFFGDLFEESFPFRNMRRFPSLNKMREFMTISPAVDMYDDEKEIVVKAEVPGIDKDDINITVTDNTLIIKGETKKDEETKEEDYYYAERTFGSFSRRLELPEKVQESKIKANFKDGILEVHLPKAPEAKAKKIKVEAK